MNHKCSGFVITEPQKTMSDQVKEFFFQTGSYSSLAHESQQHIYATKGPDELILFHSVFFYLFCGCLKLMSKVNVNQSRSSY